MSYNEFKANYLQAIDAHEKEPTVATSSALVDLICKHPNWAFQIDDELIDDDRINGVIL